MNKKLKHGWLVTLIFSVISLLYLYPIILVVINSFKKKAYISRVPFDLPKDNMFVGMDFINPVNINTASPAPNPR